MDSNQSYLSEFLYIYTNHEEYNIKFFYNSHAKIENTNDIQ